MPTSVYRFVLSADALNRSRPGRARAGSREDHEGLVGDLVRFDLPAGFDLTKLSLEDRRVLPLERQQPAQIGVDVGELEHVRLHVGGLRCQGGPHLVLRKICGLGIRIPGEVLRQ